MEPSHSRESRPSPCLWPLSICTEAASNQAGNASQSGDWVDDFNDGRWYGVSSRPKVGVDQIGSGWEMSTTPLLRLRESLFFFGLYAV